jgi:hypothetical protein
VRAHAKYLHSREAGYVFTVKANTPRLHAAIKGLDWGGAGIVHPDPDRGHGRLVYRDILVLPDPGDLPFPHAAQAWRIDRKTADPATGRVTSVETVYGVTNLSRRALSPPTLADLVRAHWGIEALHWVRDCVNAEENSKARTRSGPRVMAALRNFAVGAHRLAGRCDITEATRAAARRADRPFRILNLIPTA